MKNVNYCLSDYKKLPLTFDFALELAIKKTGMTLERLEELCGVYKRGPKKGKLKGHITYFKVTNAGWVRVGRREEGGLAKGFVCKKTGICYSFGLILEEFRQPNKVLWGWGENYPNEQDLAKVLLDSSQKVW